MPVILNKDQQSTTRQIGVDRTAAVSRVVEARRADAVPPIEKSGPQIPSDVAPTEPTPPTEAKPDPAHLVEIERRERALDAAKHEHELTKREMEQLKAQLKDPESALRAAGYSVESFVERWLNDGKSPPSDSPPSAATPPQPQENALEQRIKQLEAERDNERAQARLRTRRQEIEAMIPQDSEDFDVIRGLGAVDQFMSVLDSQEKQRPGGLGPNEVKAMLSEFEGASRKNVTAQISQLAKTKFGRNLLAELLQKSSQTAQTAQQTGRETAVEPQQTPGEDSGFYRRGMELRGRTTEQLREAAKRKALSRGL